MPRTISAPTEVAGCVLWVDGSRVTLDTASNVSQWPDRSGVDNHPTQAAPGARPAMGTTPNGRPCLVFDGVDDFLNVNVALPQPHTVFIVGKWGGGVGSMISGGGNQTRFWRASATQINYHGGSGTSILVNGVTPDLWHVHTLGFAGASSLYAQDAAAMARVNSGTSAATAITIGTYTTSYALCSVAEVVVYSRLLSEGERALVERFLADKYGLYVIGPIESPTEIQGCALWLDAMDTASLVKNASGLVAQWNDKSASAAHATEPLPANQPIYTALGFDGYPGLEWGNGEAPARRLATPNISYASFAAFFAMKAYLPVGGYVYAHQATSGGTYDYIYSSGNPHITIRRAAGGVSGRNVNPFSSSIGVGYPAAFRDNTRHVITRLGTSLHAGNQVRSDGRLEMNSTYSTLANDPGSGVSTGQIFLGNSEQATPASPLKGTFGEVVFINRETAIGEAIAVERYLRRKWAIMPARVIESPLELTDCGLWLDAAQGVSLDASGLVTQWNDRSPVANHAVQLADTTRRPTVATVGASTVIRFDGLNDQLSLTTNIPSTAITYFAVCRLRSNPTAVYRVLVLTQYVSFYASTPDAGNFGLYMGGPLSANDKIGTSLMVVSATADAYRYSMLRSYGQIKRLGRGTALTNQPTSEIGATSGTQAADLDLAELIIYNRNLTEGESSLVEQYLGRKYGLSRVPLMAA